MRTVTSHLELDIRGTTNMVFGIAAALGPLISSERLSFVVDGVDIAPTELVGAEGTRLHQFVSEAGANGR